MAEYYPLIDRAIASLPDSTVEARGAIYERARAALLGQLRKTEPAVPEADIARESAALDEAIARVEAKFTQAPASTPAAASPAPVRRSGAAEGSAPSGTSPPRDTDRPPSRPAPALPAAIGPTGPPPTARRPGAPALPTGKAPPVVPPATRERPVIGPAPVVAGETRPAVQPARPLAANRPGRPILPSRPKAGSTPDADSPPAEPDAGDAAAADREKPALPPVADLAVTSPRPEPDAVDAPEADGERRGAGGAEPRPPAARGRDGAMRPTAPRQAPPRRFGRLAATGAGVVAIVMIAVGILAWTLRDKPEQLAAAHPVTQAPDTPPAGKIGDRASPGQDGSADGTGAAVPPPVGGEGDGGAGPALAVAQRAALLVDAPDDPQKVRTYPGSVVWHLESVSPGQGLPLAPAIKADIDIPEAKLKIAMVVQKNLEPQLPASNTIELRFIPQPGYALGGVIQINVPDMRKDEAPSGNPLQGVPVMIDANNFLVGLSRGAAEEQNRRLITERNWFDVSVLFAPKRPAKLTFEKGVDGQRLWEQAIAAWGETKGTAGAAP